MNHPRQYNPAPVQRPAAPYPYPHHAENVIYQQAAPRQRETSLGNVTVPLLMVGSVCAFLIYATYQATSQFADIKYAIKGLTDKIDAMTGELNNRINRIEAEQANSMTKRDHDVWCAKAERANHSLGWTCSSEPPSGRAPTVQGWQARTK